MITIVHGQQSPWQTISGNSRIIKYRRPSSFDGSRVPERPPLDDEIVVPGFKTSWIL